MENLLVQIGSKEEKYAGLLPQLVALWTGENDLTANMANTTAALKESFDFQWVGFYLVKETELVLGPFQGPVACTRIVKGKGVCGTSWANQETIIVPDVNLFPGHIACSVFTKSEIVVPVFGKKEIQTEHSSGEPQVIAVLDIDSSTYNDFDGTDQKWLVKICQKLMEVAPQVEKN